MWPTILSWTQAKLKKVFNGSNENVNTLFKQTERGAKQKKASYIHIHITQKRSTLLRMQVINQRLHFLQKLVNRPNKANIIKRSI